MILFGLLRLCACASAGRSGADVSSDGDDDGDDRRKHWSSQPLNLSGASPIEMAIISACYRSNSSPVRAVGLITLSPLVALKEEEVLQNLVIFRFF